MKISEHCINLTKQSESCRLTAYPDPATGGAPWTIGWGNTHPVDGVPIHPGMTITQDVADRLLSEGLDRCGDNVWGMLSDTASQSITQHQFDALVDFAYNVGETNLRHSTLLRDINSGNSVAATAEFPRWNHANGHVERGLTVRRQAEARLFAS